MSEWVAPQAGLAGAAWAQPTVEWKGGLSGGGRPRSGSPPPRPSGAMLIRTWLTWTRVIMK